MVRSISLALSACVLMLAMSQMSCESIQLSDIHVSWINRGSKTDFTVTVPLSGRVKADNFWLGVGLNTARRMHGTNVVVCKVWRNNRIVQHNYNEQYTSVLFDERAPTLAISNPVISAVDKNFTCSFTRDNEHNIENYLNLNKNKKAYVIVAYGTPRPDGEIQEHVFKQASAVPLEFAHQVERIITVTPAVPVTTAAPITPVAPVTLVATTVQPIKLRRFLQVLNSHSGHYEADSFELKWTDSDPCVNFNIKAKVGRDDNVYAAIGFSDDKKMGRDDVYACVYSDKLKTVVHYYNNEKIQTVLFNASDPSFGVKNPVVKVENGMLTCSFDREITIANLQPKFANLYKPHFLLMVWGPTGSNGAIQKHSAHQTSETKIGFVDRVPHSALARALF